MQHFKEDQITNHPRLGLILPCKAHYLYYFLCTQTIRLFNPLHLYFQSALDVTNQVPPPPDCLNLENFDDYIFSLNDSLEILRTSPDVNVKVIH